MYILYQVKILMFYNNQTTYFDLLICMERERERSIIAFVIPIDDWALNAVTYVLLVLSNKLVNKI